MKQSLLVLALLGITEARHHHHHRQVLAQAPADDAAPKPWNPAESRKVFVKARDAATNTVATQQGFEATKTADVAARNAANTKETFDLKRKVRDARQNQIENNVNHAQWVTRSNHSNWAQTSTPEDSRKAFESGVASADGVVAKQQAEEDKSVASSTAAQEKYEKQTFDKNAATTAARMDQIRNGAKVSKDSKGWRVIWPAGSLSQTPEEAAAAKAAALKLTNQVVNIQGKDENKKVTEITHIHDQSTDTTAKANLDARAARDDQIRGGVKPARDSLGWSLSQMDGDSTLAGKGQIMKVKEFLTPDFDFGDHSMTNFAQKGDTIGDQDINEKVYNFVNPLISLSRENAAQINRSDLIGDEKIDPSVYNFVNPLISLSRESAAQIDHRDTIGTEGYNEKVQAFVRPNIQYQNADGIASQTRLVQASSDRKDTIGTEGYNEKVQAFVRPNIQYQNADGLASQNRLVQVDSKFLGNPERVNILDPIAYQTRANSNTLDDIQVRRTAFYNKKNAGANGQMEMI